MDGYHLYLNGEFVRGTRQSRIALPAAASGTVMIRAVGAGGEYVGQRHALTDEPVPEPAS
jgi:hypothetical protein